MIRAKQRIEDRAYYRRRAWEERQKASTCEDNTVALTHLKMAEEYDKRTRFLATTA
jgi:mannitol/fructose-specific phosphotransferase system IIA component (Ntr-type)